MRIPNFVICIFLCSLLVKCSSLDTKLPVEPTAELNVHPTGWMDAESGDSHGRFIRNTNWDLQRCRKCHGLDYAGGLVGSTCLGCHQRTPEDCNVCHGTDTDLTGAPPADIDGNTSTTETGVGAHQVHLAGGTISQGFQCSVCHIYPEHFSSAGHIDSELPAEVTFSGLAIHGNPAASWNGKSCQATYCHGNAEPQWTTVNGTQAACGTCHGLPPATGHPGSRRCHVCHAAVVDITGTIIDTEKHIDGHIDLGS